MAKQGSFFKKQRVPNPCVNLCSLNGDNICIGCYRTIDEVGAWGRLNDEERLRVLENCEMRFQEVVTRED